MVPGRAVDLTPHRATTTGFPPPHLPQGIPYQPALPPWWTCISYLPIVGFIATPRYTVRTYAAHRGWVASGFAGHALGLVARFAGSAHFHVVRIYSRHYPPPTTLVSPATPQAGHRPALMSPTVYRSSLITSRWTLNRICHYIVVYRTVRRLVTDARTLALATYTARTAPFACGYRYCCRDLVHADCYTTPPGGGAVILPHCADSSGRARPKRFSGGSRLPRRTGEFGAVLVTIPLTPDGCHGRIASRDALPFPPTPPAPPHCGRCQTVCGTGYHRAFPTTLASFGRPRVRGGLDTLLGFRVLRFTNRALHTTLPAPRRTGVAHGTRWAWLH